MPDETRPDAADERRDAPDAEEREAEEIREEQEVTGDPPLEHLASGRYDEDAEKRREDDRPAPNPPA